MLIEKWKKENRGKNTTLVQKSFTLEDALTLIDVDVSKSYSQELTDLNRGLQFLEKLILDTRPTKKGISGQISCPRCGSEYTSKNGTKSNQQGVTRQEIRCSSCRKYSLISEDSADMKPYR